MPQGYERSRARIKRDYGEDPGDYGRPVGGGGGGGRNRLTLIAGAAVVVIVVVIIAVVIAKNMFGPAPAGGEGDLSAPTDTTEFQTDTPLPDDTASIEPTDTPQVSETASESPADSSQAGETVSESPTDTSGSSSSDSSDNSSSDNGSSDNGSSDNSNSDNNTAALSVPAIQGTTANVAEYLPLRSSASSSSSTLVKIPKDDKFTILAVSTTSTWLKAKYSGKTGYVLAKYVKVGSSSSNKVCTITSTTVNVRSGADTTHSIVGTLKKNDTVVVTSGSGSSWYKVSVGSKTGYISKQYCRISSD